MSISRMQHNNRPPLDIYKIYKRQQVRKEKYQIRRIVARVFCDTEYGLSAFLSEVQHLKLHITINRRGYKALAQTVAYNAIRALQAYLIIHCDPKLKKLSLTKLKSAYMIILECRKNLQQRDCHTLFKFIRKEYKLTDRPLDTEVNPEEANKLYRSLIELLQNKLGRWHSSTGETVFQQMEESENKKKLAYLTSIWNPQLKAHLIFAYRQFQNFSLIKNDFQAKFPSLKTAFTSQSLCHQFYKILKAVIRRMEKLLKCLGSWNFPPLVKLSSRVIRQLVSPSKGKEIRWKLIELSQKQKVSTEEIVHIINLLNQYHNFKPTQQTPTKQTSSGKGAQSPKNGKYLINRVLMGECGWSLLEQLFIDTKFLTKTTFTQPNKQSRLDFYNCDVFQNKAGLKPFLQMKYFTFKLTSSLPHKQAGCFDEHQTPNSQQADEHSQSQQDHKEAGLHQFYHASSSSQSYTQQ